MIRMLWKYLKPYWLVTLLAPLFMALEVTMDLMQPKLMARIIDQGIVMNDLQLIQQTGLLMLGIAFIGLLGGLGCVFFSGIASQNFGTDVRRDLYAKVQSFSFRKLEQFSTGSLVTRLTNDVTQAQHFVMMMLRMMVRTPLLSLGSLIMAFTISVKLGLILLLVTPILFFVLFFIIRKGFPLFSRMQKKMDDINSVLQENFAGIRVVKAFVRSKFENSRFRRTSDEFMDISIKAQLVMATMVPIMVLVLNVTIVGVVWMGGHLTWEGSMPVGDLVAFINYVVQVLMSLMMIGMLLMQISRAKVSTERINEVLESDSGIEDGVQAVKHNIREGTIRFENVSFAYDDDQVLRGVTFEARAGQTVAILGATGSGKSTLVSLIPRLYEATEGKVLVDGIDVNDYELHSLRSQIGVVLQESILFSGTIAENIRYGKPEATQDEVEWAAKAAQAHGFVAELPDGYDTVLGQRGVNLSGGQKQRLSIARALLVQPKILILDDSTSAVDLGTESRIQKALKEQASRSTCIIIAQRITSVMDADNIIVLDKGEIVAQGTHDELMKSSDVYQEIYRSQLGKEDVVNG